MPDIVTADVKPSLPCYIQYLHNSPNNGIYRTLASWPESPAYMPFVGVNDVLINKVTQQKTENGDFQFQILQSITGLLLPIAFHFEHQMCTRSHRLT